MRVTRMLDAEKISEKPIFFFRFTDVPVVFHVGFREMEKLSVISERAESGLERFAAQEIQYDVDAFGLGQHLQSYVEFVIRVYQYSRSGQLRIESRGKNISLPNYTSLTFRLIFSLKITSGYKSHNRSVCCVDSTTAYVSHFLAKPIEMAA